MQTLKDLKSAVKQATHMTLVETDKPHKYVGVRREIAHVNTVGFALYTPAAKPEKSYMDWPRGRQLTFFPDYPRRFCVETEYVKLVYEFDSGNP